MKPHGMALVAALLWSFACNNIGSDGSNTGGKPVCQEHTNDCPVACSCPPPSSCLARRGTSYCKTNCTADASLCAEDEICVAIDVVADETVIVGECRRDCASEPCPPDWGGCNDVARFDSGEYLYVGATVAILGGERVKACNPY